MTESWKFDSLCPEMAVGLQIRNTKLPENLIDQRITHKRISFTVLQCKDKAAK